MAHHQPTPSHHGSNTTRSDGLEPNAERNVMGHDDWQEGGRSRSSERLEDEYRVLECELGELRHRYEVISAHQESSPKELSDPLAQADRHRSTSSLNASNGSSPLRSASFAVELDNISSRTYPSKEAFRKAASSMLQATYGVNAWRQKESEDYVSVVCGRRNTTRCKWKLLAKRELDDAKEKVWSVDIGRSYCVHDHGGISARSARRKRARLDNSTSSGEETDEASGSAINVCSSTARKRRAARSRQLSPSTTRDASSPPLSTSTSLGTTPVIPSAPRVNDRYSSAEAAIQAYDRTVVPILGVSIGKTNASPTSISLSCNRRTTSAGLCKYRLALRLDDLRGDWVVQHNSHLEHNHGPVQRILKDPMWRPLKRALTLDSNKRSRRGGVVNPEMEHYNSSQEEETEAHAVSLSTHHLPSALSTRCLPLRPFALTSPPMLRPTPAASTTLFCPIPTPIATISTFLSTLTLFFNSLHPSLGALASTLHQNGMTDTALLLLFILMEEDTRDRLLTEVAVGLLQRRLLRKVLREAKDGGWSRSSSSRARGSADETLEL